MNVIAFVLMSAYLFPKWFGGPLVRDAPQETP